MNIRIPSHVVRTLRLMRNRNKPKLPTKRKNIHPNLTNANLENVHVVNINSNEWRIQPGNNNSHVPKNLLPNPKRLHITEAGPGVRVFTAKR